MPEGARVILIQCQRGEPAVWVECDDSLPREQRIFEVVPTFGLVPENATHVGSFEADGWFMGHVYEVRA
jgi:hypothetical protein